MPSAKKTPKVKKTTKAKEVSKKEPKYLLEISVNGESATYETDDVLETLKTLVMPGILKTEMVFKLTLGGETRERMLNIPTARRFFFNDTAKAILAANLTKYL
jgi:hypothetical protein